MTTYLVECYWPGVDQQQLSGAVERLAETVREESGGVGWVSSILVPDDEIVLCLATGHSAAAVHASSREAGLPAERVVPCELIRPQHGKSTKEN